MTTTGAAAPAGSAYKTILSLDGGGIRGYSTLMILEKLMGEVQKKLGLPSPPLPCKCFDIIGGTSTGGIIAILLGRLRMSASEALSAYKRIAELAFTPQLYIPFQPPTLPKYSDAKLVEAIQKELKLAEASNGNKEALFADPRAPKTVVLAITKIDVNAGPTLFRTYDVEPAWKDCKIWEVARAATTFFDPIKAGRDKIAFIDAGFGYNNPCEVLLAEADKAIPGRPTSCIVSIGTGLERAVGVSAKPFTLLKALVDMAISSHAVDSRLQEAFGSKQPQKYWRFDEDVAISEIKMDDWKELQSIAGHTHNYLNAYATTTAIHHCADALITAKPNLRGGVAANGANQPPEPVPLSEDEEAARLGFLRLLSFAEMEFREQTVDDAYKATYEWMLNSPQYSAWKKSPGGRLLIKGKAGCGKSTLMKHLFKNEASIAAAAAANAATGFAKMKPVTCGFFFNGRGGPMEKTLKGMLRTLLHQIVFQYPIAYRCLSQFHQDMKMANASRNRTVDWTCESLTKMFKIVMRSSTSPTLIFIDALDEGEGFSLAEVFALLEEQTGSQPDGNHAAASVCLSSRPDNFVNHRRKWNTTDLAEFNSEDIETYATSRLDTMAKECAEPNYEQLAAELVPEILRKADSVFLWVRLVVDEITAAMESYESKEYIRSQLFATPTDLWDRFKEILLKVKDHHISDMKRLLQVVLAAERPLSLEELIHVMPLSSSDPPSTLHDVWDVKTAEQTREDMKRRILLYCGGLVEAVETGRSFYIHKYDKLGYELTTQVQFIHQSVKDYLNSMQIREGLADVLGSPGLEENGHQLLLTACLRYLQLPETAAMADRTAPSPYTRPNNELFAFWKEVSDQYPFLLYSPFWVKHADKSVEVDPELASREGLQTMETIFYAWRFFPYPQLPKKYYDLYTHLYENMEETSDETYSGLLSFSAYQGFAHLFEKAFHAFRQDMPQLSLDQALIAACDCGLKGGYRRPGGDVGIRHRRDVESEERGFGLPEIVWQAKEAIVRVLLDGGADVNRKTGVGRFGSALTAACWGGRLSIVRRLLDHGADVNAEVQDGHYGTALIASVWGSSTAVAKALINEGAEVNAQVQAGRVGSALAEAAISGEPNMVQTLIDGGADVDLLLQNGEFGSALAAAANDGNVTTAALLVERGARVNMQTPGSYGSALAAAGLEIWGLGEEIMEMLIGAGAEVDLILESGDYGSALAAATAWGQGYGRARVEMLLRHGADPNLPLRCGYFGTALIAAACSLDLYSPLDGHGVEACAFGILVERGAEIDARPRIGKYGSALVAAASNNALDFVKHLVAHGADVNAVLDVGEYGSALAAAASCPDFLFDEAQPVVLFLLEHGADINAVLPIGTYGSALGAVLAQGRRGSSEMKRLLLSRGAKLTGNEKPLGNDGSLMGDLDRDAFSDDEG